MNSLFTHPRRASGKWCRTVSSALFLSLTAFTAYGQAALEAIRVSDKGDLVNIEAAFWDKAVAVNVPMLPQVIVPPTVPAAAIKELHVKAAHNGQWLAFLIEWLDSTRNDRIVVDQFGDQVAVELPARANEGSMPSPMMGNPGGRVSIMQWRAAFQRDIDQGEPTLRDLYPNAMVDVYPDQVLQATDARPYMGAMGVDNPISHPKRTPVLDQMAEGWGSMTVKPEQHANGRGVWQDNRWRVIIAHPLESESANDPDLQPGASTVVAFAVWDGGNQEVGSRKAWANWVPLKLAQ